MLRTLLDDTQLTCPSCRGLVDGEVQEHALFLAASHAEVDGNVVHGMLGCRGCGTQYPIVDGVPVVLRDVAGWLRQQERAVFGRSDLPCALDHWLRAAWPDDQDPSWHRQMLAVYGATLGDDPVSRDPFLAELDQTRRRTQRFLDTRRQEALSHYERGALVLDAGAAVGESALSFAAHGARVLAVDTDFGALRVLSRLLREGSVELPRWRHAGNDYVSTTVTLPKGVDPARVLPIAADAAAPPVHAELFDVVAAYNLLDNVPDPVLLLRQLHAVLRPGGRLLVASPFDWVSRCTPPHARLGEGLRANAGDGADAAEALVALLEGRLPFVAPELAFRVTHREDLPWILPRHRRSAHVFATHYVEAVKLE